MIWYTTSFDAYKVIDCKRAVALSVTLKKKLVCQVFVLLDIHHVNKARPQFTMNNGSSIK